MKLLTVIPVMGIGGAEAVAATLSTASVRRGHTVCLASAGGERITELVGVRHVAVPLDTRHAGDLARSVAVLRRTARWERPDLVHAHNVKAALIARLAVGPRIPIVATLHGVPAAEVSAAARILRRCADRVVAVSPYVADQLLAHGYPAHRVDVVENAVEPPARLPRAEARAQLGLPEDAVVGLCLARMAEQKRHDLLVEAWAHTPGHARLLLAGDGPTRPAVEAAVRRMALGDRVDLLGPRRDVDVLLSAADVLVLPTDWEGLPISLLEAMSVGLPVVVSRVGGVVETLGSAVRLVEPGSAAALADALGELIADPALRAELGERGRCLVEERFALAPVVEAYHRIYERAVGPARPSARPQVVAS